MTSVDPKIIDLLKTTKEGETPVSLEYFPPRTDEGVKVSRKKHYEKQQIVFVKMWACELIHYMYTQA